jgi:hypothetical protein
MKMVIEPMRERIVGVTNTRKRNNQGDKRPVAKKPFESGNNTHFQRQNCPGPDFCAENGKKGIFGLKILKNRHFKANTSKML